VAASTAPARNPINTFQFMLPLPERDVYAAARIKNDTPPRFSALSKYKRGSRSLRFEKRSS
jgi:hypothetical protein